MPHFVIEHGGVLDTPDRVRAAMEAVLDRGGSSGVMRREDIKVRAVGYEDFLLGDGRRGFIHLTVRLLAGRSDEQKEALAISLREGLAEVFPSSRSISIDSRDMNPVCYKKRLV